jgi:hypothetical protein
MTLVGWPWIPRIPSTATMHARSFVLEGSIVMQVKGGKEVTLTPGQTFYEGPTMFTPSAGMQAVLNRQSSSCSLLRTKALRC